MNSIGAEGYTSNISVATSVPLLFPGNLEFNIKTSGGCFSTSLRILFPFVYRAITW
jgi:hypothetical protein